MKTHWTIYLLIIGVICIAGISLFLNSHFDKVQSNEEDKEFIKELDSLSSRIETISKERDSLEHIISNTESKIDTINYWYEKELVNITNQPIRDDVKFFSDYLSQTYERFFDSNNSDTIKAN